MSEPRSSGRLPREAIVLLIVLSLAWGSFWPLMKVAVSEIPIFTFRALCAVVGGVATLALARVLGTSLRVPRAEWWPLTVLSLFNVFGWFILSALAVTLIPSGHAALIAYTLPLWTFLLGLVFLDERPSRGRWLGLVLGLGGVAILAAGHMQELGRAPLGAIAMLGGALSWAAGTVALKRYNLSIPTLSLNAWQLLIAGAPLVIVATLVDSGELGSISGKAWGGLAYTILIGIILGMYAWFRIVSLVPAGVASLSSVTVPLVAVLSGAVVLDEAIGWREISALVLIVGALATVLPLPRLTSLRRGGS